MPRRDAALAGTMCLFLLLAGAAAFLSIDRPHDYARLKASPLKAWTVLFR